MLYRNTKREAEKGGKVFMKVGFVGLGIMGRPMCKNLLKAGDEVTAFDPFAKEALDDVTACGAVRGESNADVASKSDVVITMVPNSPHVREAVFLLGMLRRMQYRLHIAQHDQWAKNVSPEFCGIVSIEFRTKRRRAQFAAI